MVAALRAGAGLAIGIDHPNYTHAVESLPAAARAALLADFA